MLDVESFVYRFFDEVGKYGNPVTDLTVDCQFCGNRVGRHDTKRHLHISINKEVVHCFRCDYKNNWVGFVMDVTGYPYYRAIGELYYTPRMKDFEKKVSSLWGDNGNPSRDVTLPEDFYPLSSKMMLPTMRLARSYLRKRGFNAWYWKRYNLGVADSVPHRVIIPVEKNYWQGRRLHEWMEPKYLNPKIPSGDLLFNAPALEQYEEVVICEGAFSAMHVGTNAIALIGKEVPKEKLERLAWSKVSRFIVALDSDATLHAVQLANKLSKLGKMDIIVWKYQDGDPAENNGVVVAEEYNFKYHVASLLK